MLTRESRYSFRRGLPKYVIATPLFTLRYSKNTLFRTQCAIVVGKKVDKRAVVRNKLKRRAAHALQEILKKYTVGSYNLVFFLKKQVHEVTVDDIQQEMIRSLEKAGVLLRE